MKRHQYLSMLPLVLVTATVALPSYSVEFPQTTDRGSPNRSVGLGSRGGCVNLQDQPSLTTLLPHNSLATTFGSDPNIDSALFFYIPETAATGAELIIENVEGDEIYQQMVALPEVPGVIQVVLPKLNPADDPLFVADEVYYWDFALVCEGDDTSVMVSGGLQRVEPENELLDQLEAVEGDRIAQMDIYANHRAWQETIGLAAQLRAEQPQLWGELLQSVDLGTVSEMPLVGVITPE